MHTPLVPPSGLIPIVVTGNMYGDVATRTEGGRHPHKTNCHVWLFRISLIQ
jgi:hypothetical protein